MDPLDKHFKSLINNIKSDGTINIKLHAGDVTALLDCLDFAYVASKYLKDSELRRGTQDSVRKMMYIERDSRQLSQVLAQQLEIGEPIGDYDN